ncbi:RloB family protein [Flavobacterium facile]|uniref:RloB family protein n=1 Tax=Flavobacterium facile TaxID=2893174 RepID=UPI002E771017|nr:RloB family protein [Flavobacterium sp. T-12]
MSQHFRKTILIVCEGARTEPDYFKEFRDIIIEKDKTIFITIDPIPKDDKIKEEEEIAQKIREGGRSRTLKNPQIQFPDLEVEEEYLTQPIYYVRKAQLGLVDSVYDEVWAVYDKDGHAAHEQAFDLTNNVIEGKKVNVAFNSIAFEYWVLLHFESNSTAFQKSMCRTNLPNDKKDYHFCGENTHALDCQGVSCVCGRIVNQNYLSYIGGKKEFLFSDYFGNVNHAIENAVILRNSYIGNQTPIYDLNPYTNTYRIVFKLLQLPETDYTWFDFTEVQSVDFFSYSFEIQNPIVKISVINTELQRNFLNVNDICLISSNGDKLDCGIRHLMDSNENYNFEIDLNTIRNFTPFFIGIRKNEQEYYITELPI